MTNTDRIERIAQDIWANRAADLADGDEQFIAYYVADEAGHLYNGEFEAIVARIVELSNARRNS